MDVARREMAWEVDYLREAKNAKHFRWILKPFISKLEAFFFKLFACILLNAKYGLPSVAPKRGHFMKKHDLIWYQT